MKSLYNTASSAANRVGGDREIARQLKADIEDMPDNPAAPFASRLLVEAIDLYGRADQLLAIVAALSKR